MFPYIRRFYREYLPGHGWTYFWGLSCLLLTVLATIRIPHYLATAVNGLDRAVPAGQPPDATLRQAALAIMVLGVLLAVFRILSRVLIFIPGRRIEAGIRQHYFEALTTLPPEDLYGYSTGDLISRGSSDVTAVRILLSMGFLHSTNTLLLVGMCLYNMLHISWQLTLFCLIPAPVLQLFVKKFSKRMMDQSRTVQAELGRLTGNIRELFSMHTLISIYPVFEQLFRGFQKRNRIHSDAAEKLVTLRIGLFSTVASFSNLAQFILLLTGGLVLLRGEASFAIGEFLAFMMYLAMIQEPLRSSAFLVSIFQRGEVCLERLYALMDRAKECQRIQDARPIQSVDDLEKSVRESDILLSVHGLDFSYPALADTPARDKPFVLRVPGLEIRQGKRYGVFGAVGSGKTTLLHILTGNIQVSEGVCHYRGVDYCAIRTQVLLDRFAYAPQESRHFARTIRENLEQVSHNAFLRDHACAGTQTLSFEDALLVSQLQPDVEGFPDGLDTLLGENGINLSGGQRQRLAIMRALLKPHTLLVLDDVISAVDHRTEVRILRELFGHLRGQALIFASHRISALTACDEIFVLENGRIAARGTHQDLLRIHAVYRRTYMHQVVEQEKAVAAL